MVADVRQRDNSWHLYGERASRGVTERGRGRALAGIQGVAPRPGYPTRTSAAGAWRLGASQDATFKLGTLANSIEACASLRVGHCAARASIKLFAGVF